MFWLSMTITHLRHSEREIVTIKFLHTRVIKITFKYLCIFTEAFYSKQNRITGISSPKQVMLVYKIKLILII
jgi:hypothetical protein